MGSKVIIQHPNAGTARVSASSVQAWERRGWKVLDASAPRDDVLAAAEALGVAVDDEAAATTESILSVLTPPEPYDPDADRGGEDVLLTEPGPDDDSLGG